MTSIGYINKFMPEARRNIYINSQNAKERDRFVFLYQPSSYDDLAALRSRAWKMVSAFFASRSPCFLHQCSNLRLIFPISSWISLDWCFDVEFYVILVFYLIWRCAFHEICCNGTWLKEKKRCDSWFLDYFVL